MRSRPIIAGATAVALVLALGLVKGPDLLLAADHLDAPGLMPPGGDLQLDINDVYAFQSPTNSNNAVVIMTVSPLAIVDTFSTTGRYEFVVDTDGDAKPDATARFTFGAPDSSGAQSWRLKGTGQAAKLSGTGTTGVTTDLSGGGRVVAGEFDDPFFFDLVNFLAADFSCTDASNFFAGANTLGIVLEVPRAWIANDQAGIWARTILNETQVDRMGRPAINTVFIPNNIFEPVGSEPSQRNAFNAGKPQHDRRDFRGEVIDTLELFYGEGNAEGLADILLPDILTVDFSSTAGFLNGRQLADDVIDIELGIVTNGAVTSDCVDNDSAFPGTFPYLAPANP